MPRIVFPLLPLFSLWFEFSFSFSSFFIYISAFRSSFGKAEILFASFSLEETLSSSLPSFRLFYISMSLLFRFCSRSAVQSDVMASPLHQTIDRFAKRSEGQAQTKRFERKRNIGSCGLSWRECCFLGHLYLDKVNETGKGGRCFLLPLNPFFPGLTPFSRRYDRLHCVDARYIPLWTHRKVKYAGTRLLAHMTLSWHLLWDEWNHILQRCGRISHQRDCNGSRLYFLLTFRHSFAASYRLSVHFLFQTHFLWNWKSLVALLTSFFQGSPTIRCARVVWHPMPSTPSMTPPLRYTAVFRLNDWMRFVDSLHILLLFSSHVDFHVYILTLPQNSFDCEWLVQYLPKKSHVYVIDYGGPDGPENLTPCPPLPHLNTSTLPHSFSFFFYSRWYVLGEHQARLWTPLCGGCESRWRSPLTIPLSPRFG